MKGITGLQICYSGTGFAAVEWPSGCTTARWKNSWGLCRAPAWGCLWVLGPALHNHSLEYLTDLSFILLLWFTGISPIWALLRALFCTQKVFEKGGQEIWLSCAWWSMVPFLLQGLKETGQSFCDHAKYFSWRKSNFQMRYYLKMFSFILFFSPL